MQYPKITQQAQNSLTLTDAEGSEDVLLPSKYAPKNWNPDDQLQVFVFKDSEDNLVAITAKSLIKLNEFAFMQVKVVNEFGTFLECGLDTDLFVPFREQPGQMQPSNWHIVFCTSTRNRIALRLHALPEVLSRKFYPTTNRTGDGPAHRRPYGTGHQRHHQQHLTRTGICQRNFYCSTPR